ncbi:hypothetical protein Tco_1373971, partial [Tanacetum coccineum]
MLTTLEICSRFALNSQARNLKILYLKKRYSLSLEILDTLCLSEKTTALESLRLLRAQILWGMYHNKNVDYVYLLWEDLVYQVENKNSKNNNDIYYPRFTKVIVDYFMAKDLRNTKEEQRVLAHDWDDLCSPQIRVISKHHDHNRCTALFSLSINKTKTWLILKPTRLTVLMLLVKRLQNQNLQRRKLILNHLPRRSLLKLLKEKESRLQLRELYLPRRTNQQQSQKGLTVLSEVALTEAEQMKISLKRSKTQQHISHKSSDEEDDDKVNMGNDNDDDVDNQDDDDQEHDGQDDEEQDDVNEQTISDNNGDDFVHPKLSTHDEEYKEEEDSDPRVHTPSNYESTDDEESDEEIQGANVKGEEMDEEDEANELYRDVNDNLEGRDTKMTDAPRTIVKTTQVIEDIHVIITPVNPEAQQQSFSVSSGFVSNMLNTSPDTSIDSIFNLNTESTLLIDVLITTIFEPPLLSTTTLPPPHTPLNTHLQQTLTPTPATAPSSSLQDLPNFGSLFRFDHRLKILETDFSELMQTNQFAAAVSSIPDIVDAYLANKMHEAVKTAVQLQSDRLRNEAQAENADFINKLDDNIKKIIKDQVKEQNLYKALVDAYKSDKLILDTYGETVSFKRRRDEEDKDEEPSAGSNRGVQISSQVCSQEKEPMQTVKDLEESAHQEFETGVTEDQHDEATSHLLDWFQKLAKPPTPDRDWNKTLPDAHGPVQPWLGSLAQMEDPQLEYFLKEVYKATTDQLDWINPEGQQYPHDLESAHDVYSKRRIIVVIKLEIVEWNNYKHLDWITVRKDDDKLHKFKEGDFKRLRIQDIEDMLLLLIQGKLTNLTVEERIAFNVSLRMFTRSIIIQ